MKMLRVEDAVGQVLCHDLTRIVKDEYKDAQFRKGHIIQSEDIPMLLSMGKEHVYVWELQEGMLHENDAALRLCKITQNEKMRQSEIKEGKIELFAEEDGFFQADLDKLEAINSLDDIMIAIRHSATPVKKNDKLAGMRVIPLVVKEEKLFEAEGIAAGAPILSLTPYRRRKAGVITTGSEVFHGRISDTFTPVVEDKLSRYGIALTEHITVDDGMDNLLTAIAAMRKKDIELLLCTGGMSVDPDDNTPGAIKKSGAKIISYGAPVLPGAMFLIGYYENGLPVMGLPGCVMYAGATIFDLILPRVAADIPVTKRDIVKLGNGGLCLGCKPCRYPLCPFGK